MKSGNKRRFITLAAMLTCICCDACNETVQSAQESPQKPGNDKPVDNPPIVNPGDDDPVEVDTRPSDLRPSAMMSNDGCLIDSDCVTGAFCFHGVCAIQCKKDDDCKDGYVCSTRNGRCITEAFAKTMATADDAGDSDSGLTTKRLALTDLNKQDIAEAKASDVVTQLPNAEILTPPLSVVYVSPGQTSVGIKLTTSQDYGDVDFLVRSVELNKVSAVRRASKSVNEATGLANYVFDVEPGSSSLGDQGKPEQIQIESALGTFDVKLSPLAPVAGIYEGSALANRFAGEPLPIRFAVVTNPENPKSYAEIQGITLYMPSSQHDLFSPEPVTDNTTSWASVEMKHESNGKNCQNGKDCWAASYAVNDFQMAGSSLIDANQKLARAVRIEINDFDAEDSKFFGIVKDDISGLYRDVDTTTGQKFWAVSSMLGSFNAMRVQKFDANDATVHAHQIATQSTLRAIDDISQISCTNADIEKLMALAAAQPDLESCASIHSLQDWMNNSENLHCIAAASKSILDDDNLTSKIISKLIARKEDDTSTVAGFATLNDFLDNCLLKDDNEKKTVCIQKPEVNCAADLSAFGFLNAKENAERENFMNQFHGLLRESYLGMQYAAYQQDIITRQKWLDTADAPKFMAKDIENAIADVLADWEVNVLNGHLGVMHKQFGQLPLEVLSNLTSSSDEISSERYTILSDYQQAWQSVSNAISVSLRRNNELLTKTTERTAKAAQFYPRLFDLYIAGIIESEINKNTGNTSLNGGYGNSFYDNLSSIKKLDQSFDALVYMRDAEIAVSNSLNKDNDNVLSRRAEKAKSTLQTVTQKRDKVFKDYRDRKISQQTTSASLSNSIESQITEIVNICGLPAACRTTDIQKVMSRPECEPLALPFYCGFSLNSDSLPGRPGRKDVKSAKLTASVDNASGKVVYLDANGNQVSLNDIQDIQDGFDPVSALNTGEAANAILAYRKALQHVDTTVADLQALKNKVAIARQTTEAYAKSIEEWYQKRIALTDNIKADIESIKENLVGKDGNGGKLKSIKDKLDNHYNSLRDRYTEAQSDFNDWKETREQHFEKTKTYITNIEQLERLSYDIESSAEIVSKTISEAAEINYIGGNRGDSESIIAQASYTASMALHGIDAGQWSLLKAAATAKADQKTMMERDKDLADAKWEYQQELDEEEAKVKDKQYEAEYVQSLNEFESAIAEADIQNEVLRSHIELLKEEFNREDTYARDCQALKKMRNEYKMLAQDLMTKSALVIEARMDADNALQHYLTLTQRAAMLKSQYDTSTERLAKINNLYTAPAVVFTYASDLEAVENKIELAKERIYDYLAALEYNAVRPFVDIRRAVYLARSPNDLDAILEQLENVSDNCGGKINNVDDDHAIIVSTREMMGITADFKNMTMKDRFHYVISAGNVPIKSLTRYTVDITGKELLSSGHDLKSGTFELTIRDFANLQATCNAKIAGFAFKIVGENLIKENAGEQVHPTMTMFYNGKSTLTSCQPDISEVVAELGNSTAYGKYSTFNIEQTKISPNAGINDWGNIDMTLEQYPLASSYTVLIDSEIGENSKINWDNVEDIQIKVLYTYENVRTTNKCKY